MLAGDAHHAWINLFGSAGTPETSEGLGGIGVDNEGDDYFISFPCAPDAFEEGMHVVDVKIAVANQRFQDRLRGHTE